VEIPAPERVHCAEHGAVAILIQTPRGQVRYVSHPDDKVATEKPDY
jgi:hypothetical protein